MSDVLHIGFSGTRYGMTLDQLEKVRALVLACLPGATAVHAHHGDCVGADAEIHRVCRGIGERMIVEVHPGQNGEFRAGCFGDFCHDPLSHMKRNAAIVAASHIMIAAPYENEPQPRGGTWATIGMARKALKRGTLRALYVVGREGQLLEHEGWK